MVALWQTTPCDKAAFAVALVVLVLMPKQLATMEAIRSTGRRGLLGIDLLGIGLFGVDVTPLFPAATHSLPYCIQARLRQPRLLL